MSPYSHKTTAVKLCSYVKFKIIFLSLHLPNHRILLNILECMMLSDIERCGSKFCPPVWFMCMVSFSHFLLIVNSSVNIIIYCFIGDGFRLVIHLGHPSWYMLHVLLHML